MIIEDIRELQFMKKKGPRGLSSMVAQNLKISIYKATNELRLIKDEYNEEIITEARRLCKEFNGAVYHPNN